VRVMDAAHSLFAGDRVRAITASRPAAVALSARTPIGVAAQSLARVITLPSLFWLGRMGELSALCEAWASEASACGDRHVEASCLVFQAYRHLREDDVAAALAALARARSVDIDYQHPVLTDPWWASNVALYADDAASALAFCSDTRLSQLPRTLATPGAVGFWALASGTSAAALAIQTPARRSEALTRLAHEITLAKRAFLAPAHGVIAQLEATHAVLTDRTQPVDALLERAAKHYDALGWKLHAASMQLARAQRTTSHHASLEQRALAVIAAEGIANPWRWAEMLAPALVRAPRRSSG
jgi:hypothetical protein